MPGSTADAPLDPRARDAGVRSEHGHLMATPTGQNSVDRALGRVEGKLEEVLESRRRRDEQVDDRLAAIETDLRVIRELLANARGGWKTLLLIGGIAGTVGGWLIPAFFKKIIGGLM